MIDWLDIIWIGKGVSTLGQMWLVEIVPIKCTTTHVLLSNLKSFSMASQMVELQFFLMAFLLAMRSEPMQVLTRLV